MVRASTFLTSLTLAALALLVALVIPIPIVHIAPAYGSQPAIAQQEPPPSSGDQGGSSGDQNGQTEKKGDLNVNVKTSREETVWYANPLWIVLGILAAIVIIALIVLAARGGSGGGTTVVRQ